MQVEGKRIVLTGAASGIGRELLRLLAYYDVEIIAADRDATGLGEAVRAPVNARASLNPFVCDLSTQAGTDQLFAHAMATLNGIDIFIANAGFAYYGRLGPADWDQITAIYSVNTFSPLYSTLKMAELNPDAPYLTVITASTMAHWGLAGYALYGSTKAALNRFAESYRAELPPNGRLMLVYPLGTRTRFFEQANAPLPFPIQSPQQVARAIVRGIERDADTVYPSRLWRIGYALNRIIPVLRPLIRYIYRRIFYNWEAEQNGSA
jgi:uncharacterized protein